jgi:hypothetical protein
MIHLGFFETFGIAVICIGIVIVITKLLDRDATIRIERSTGNARANNLGAMMARSECPVCHETEGFFYGPAKPEYATLYCGNPGCRAGFRVENYGNSMVYAEPDELGPDQLYLGAKTKSPSPALSGKGPVRGAKPISSG